MRRLACCLHKRTVRLSVFLVLAVLPEDNEHDGVSGEREPQTKSWRTSMIFCCNISGLGA